MATKGKLGEEDRIQEEEKRSLKKAIIRDQRVLAKSRESGSDDAFRTQQLYINDALFRELGLIS